MRLYERTEYRELEKFLKEYGETSDCGELEILEDMEELYERDTVRLYLYYTKYFREDFNERLDIISTYGIDTDFFFGDVDVSGKTIGISFQQIIIMVYGYYIDDRFRLNREGIGKLDKVVNYKGKEGTLSIDVSEYGIYIHTTDKVTKEDILNIFKDIKYGLKETLRAYDELIR